MTMVRTRKLDDYEKVEPAAGMRGYIIGEYFRLVTGKNDDGTEKFVDLNFRYPDLEVTIVSLDACVYYPKDSTKPPFLDCSPQTYGLK